MQICIAKKDKLQSKISKLSSIALDLSLSKKLFIIGKVIQPIRPAPLAEIQHRALAMCNNNNNNNNNNNSSSSSSSNIFREQGVSWVARSLEVIQLGTRAARGMFFFSFEEETQIGTHIVGEGFNWRLFHGWAVEVYVGIWRFTAGELYSRVNFRGIYFMIPIPM